MRVGLVIYGSIDTVSGGYLYDRKLIEHLRSCGDEVRILSLPPAAYPLHLLDNLSFRLPGDLDVIVEDELVHPSLLIANAARDPERVPVISLVHNLHSEERRPAWQKGLFRLVERAYLRTVDGFIFNSTATAGSVWRLVGRDKACVLAPPGGDRLGSLQPAEIEKRASRGGPLRLLFLAAVTPLKGFDVLLDALAGLPGDSCTLDVAGSVTVEPGFARAMQARARELRVPVIFHGVLDGEPLKALLRESDVLAIPSYYEGFGISFLEGMGYGLPAVGTSAGAMPQMITPGENGFLIAPGDSAALAAIFRQLLSDRELLRRTSLGARRFFAAASTWSDTGLSIRLFLEQAVARGHSRGQRGRE